MANQTTSGSKKFEYNGVDYSYVFDPIYYAKNNPDVKEVLGTDEKKLFFHFTRFGMKEGRKGNASFNVSTYKSNNPELRKRFGNDNAKFYEYYCIQKSKEATAILKGGASSVDANIKKLIALAEQEIGYLEKKSNDQLDDKTANAGSNNYTKYGRDMSKWVGSPYTNGAAWCQTFCSWCLCSCFGINQAKRLGGGWTAYTPTASQYYKNMGRWYTSNPQPGDQIFFKNTTRICHTGLVYSVDANYVYTIEGNTSGASGVIANGGGVCNKKYALNYKNIAGYGRPDYSILEGGDGIDPNKTSSKNELKCPYSTPTQKVKKGDHGTAVMWVQWMLNTIDGANLVIDGILGSNSYDAIINFQKKYGLTPDGIVGPATRSKILEKFNKIKSV